MCLFIQKIPVLSLHRKGSIIRRLLTKKSNIEFLNHHYPLTYNGYLRILALWKKGAVLLVAIALAFQLINLVLFAMDSKEALEKARNKAAQLR